MSNKNYFVFIKCDETNELFDIGYSDSIDASVTMNTTDYKKSMVTKELMFCNKLIYFECGFSLAQAKRRVEALQRLSPSKRRVLVEKQNPNWINLLQEWHLHKP